jgi:hypothetical protein
MSLPGGLEDGGGTQSAGSPQVSEDGRLIDPAAYLLQQLNQRVGTGRLED